MFPRVVKRRAIGKIKAFRRDGHPPPHADPGISPGQRGCTKHREITLSRTNKPGASVLGGDSDFVNRLRQRMGRHKRSWSGKLSRLDKEPQPSAAILPRSRERSCAPPDRERVSGGAICTVWYVIKIGKFCVGLELRKRTVTKREESDVHRGTRECTSAQN